MLEGRFSKSSAIWKILLFLPVFSIFLYVAYESITRLVGDFEASRRISVNATDAWGVLLLFVIGYMLYNAISDFRSSSKVVLRISRDGFLYTPWSRSIIEWSNINKIGMIYMPAKGWGGRYFMMVDLKNPALNPSEHSRILTKFVPRRGILIRIDDLDVSYTQFIDAVQAYSEIRISDISKEGSWFQLKF
jgi:hypothetical protein